MRIHVSILVKSHNFYGNVNSFKTHKDFCKWLISRDHEGYIAIAHYSKGYDSYFILKYGVENVSNLSAYIMDLK